MTTETQNGPTPQQVFDAMRIIEDTIGIVRCSRPHPDDLQRLMTAIAPIPELIRNTYPERFSSYLLGIAIADATQIMREMERRPPVPKKATLIGRLIAKLKGGQALPPRQQPLLVVSGGRFGKGTPASVIPALIKDLGPSGTKH